MTKLLSVEISGDAHAVCTLSESETWRHRQRTRKKQDKMADRTMEQLAVSQYFSNIEMCPMFMKKDQDSQEVYKALLKTVPSSQIKGIQRIGGLWRLYVTQLDFRIGLITSGINIRNACIAVYDSNPFLPGGNENILRLTVKDIPLSVDNSVIVDELEKRNYKVSGN